MSNQYILANIQKLLVEGFTETQIRNELSTYDPNFRQFYQIMHHNSEQYQNLPFQYHLLNFAQQNFRIESLLAWAKQTNPLHYERCQPYYKYNEVTRLLCATAVLNRSPTKPFYRTILKFVRAKYRAHPPELGLDMETLVQVCKFMEQRERPFRIAFTILGILMLVTFFGLGSSLVSYNSYYNYSGYYSRSESSSPIWLTILILSILGTWGSQIYKAWEERFTFPKYFTKENYKPDQVRDKFIANIDAERAGINQDSENLVVFGNYLPFVGAGMANEEENWSVSIDITIPKTQLGTQSKPQPVKVQELYSAIEQACVSLGFANLAVKDFIFVNGGEIRNDRRILPNILAAPLQTIRLPVIEGLNNYMRQYKLIQVHGWQYELIFSYFIRCILVGRNLYVESSRYLLTPLHDRYHEIDRLRPFNWKSIFGLVVRTLPVGAVYALASIIILIRTGLVFLNELLEENEQRKLVQATPTYNYGVSNSIRQWVSNKECSYYFQDIDVTMYNQTFNREILNVLVDYLEKHDIDTSELKSQSTTILNNGVIGNVSAENMAMGNGARAYFTKAATKEAAKAAAKEAAKQAKI